MFRKNFTVEKKLHAVKNLIISDQNYSVLYLSPTYEGSVHDKTICDEETLVFIKQIVLLMDSGFQGYDPENAIIKRPKKKPKNKELTTDEKKQNHAISKVRVKVEHTIGLCKIFRIVKDEIRIFKDNVRDLVMEIACGLANFKTLSR